MAMPQFSDDDPLRIVLKVRQKAVCFSAYVLAIISVSKWNNICVKNLSPKIPYSNFNDIFCILKLVIRFLYSFVVIIRPIK